MHFLRVNVMFYKAVNVIHDVSTKDNPITYTAKQLNKSDAER